MSEVVRQPEDGTPYSEGTGCTPTSPLNDVTTTGQNINAEIDRFRIILETMPSAVVIIEKLDCRITFVNRRAIELFGTSTCGEEITRDLTGFKLLRPDGTFFPPEEFPVRLALHHGETVRTTEVLMERPDGKRISLMASVSPVFGKDGDIVAAVGIFFDITERKLVEAKLREDEERFRTLYETMAQGVIYRNARGELLFANKALEKLLGISLNQMHGTTISDDIWKSIHEDGTPFRLEERASWIALHTGKEVRGVVMGIFNHLERRYRWSIVSSKPLFRPGEDKPYEVYTTSEDITELKEAQDELRRHRDHLEELVKERTRSLKESEERYRKIADSTPDFIYSLNRQGQYTTVNRAICEALRLSPEEIVGKSPTQLGFPEEVTEEVQATQQSVLERGETVVTEMVMPMPDGHIHTYEVILSPVHDEQGYVTSLSGINRDITARKRAEDELRNLTRRLAKTQEEERESIARELHDDIGQSLTVLGLKLAEAKRLYQMDSIATFGELQDMVKRITADVRNLSTGLHPGMLKTIGLQPTLEWYLGEFSKRTGIHIDFECSGLEGKDIPPEVGIAAYRILQESLTNITRHAGTDRVLVRVRASPIVLVLEVRDEGKGFNPGTVPVTSSGLRGMRERAESLDGVFSVESAPGKGTRVRTMLPIGEAWRQDVTGISPTRQ